MLRTLLMKVTKMGRSGYQVHASMPGRGTGQTGPEDLRGTTQTDVGTKLESRDQTRDQRDHHGSTCDPQRSKDRIALDHSVIQSDLGKSLQWYGEMEKYIKDSLSR